MVAIYTYHHTKGEKEGRNDFQTQGIAYSLDKGRSWTKYVNNPVLANPGIRDFRDPKVIWHEQQQKWIMTLAVADHISFYSSPNLRDWKHESDFGARLGAHGGVWECPDLFQMPVEGSREQKWVLLVSINPGGPNGGSATQYFVGEFDGKKFVMDPQFAAAVGEKGIWLDYGTDNYAGVTWSNVPREDGRRLFMGWMSNWLYANVVPTEKWRSAMTIARSLTLVNTEQGLRIASRPVKELQKLQQATYQLEQQQVSDSLTISSQLPFSTATYALSMELEAAGNFVLELSNSKGQAMRIGYDAARNEYFIDRTKAGRNDFSKDFAGIHWAPRFATGQNHQLQLYVDVASAEFFADGGKTTMTSIFFPDEPFTKLRLIGQGALNIKTGQLADLKSIWQVSN